MWKLFSRTLPRYLLSRAAVCQASSLPRTISCTHLCKVSTRTCETSCYGEVLTVAAGTAAGAAATAGGAPRAAGGRKTCRRRGLKLLASAGVLGGYCYYSINSAAVACQDVLVETLDEGDIDSKPLTRLELNEAAALTHSSLLRQASGVTVDASLQLLHRVLRARLDFSAQYRKQLNDVIDLLEYCTSVLHSPEQHDNIWGRLVVSRAEMESLKDHLKDLNILMTYAYTTLENAAMTAFISGVEFTASAAQQAINSAKAELENDTKQNLALELQYVHTHTKYIEASHKLMEEAEASSEEGAEVSDDKTKTSID